MSRRSRCTPTILWFKSNRAKASSRRPEHERSPPRGPSQPHRRISARSRCLGGCPRTLHETVQGWVPQLATEEELRFALEKAFDYRGDVTLTLKDNSKIEGYVFDRVAADSLTSSFVRVMTEDASQKLKVAYDNIAERAFT